MKKLLMFVCALLLAPLASAVDYAGAMVGNVTGLVQNAQGQMVTPRATLEAVASIRADELGHVTGADINGTASCADGLSVNITFAASYSTATGAITGFYTDMPNGQVLDKPITFTRGSGLVWIAQFNGEAPSATGKRAYSLQVEITLPREALFLGANYPADKSYGGLLVTTQNVDIPVSIPALGYNQTHTITLDLNGEWAARGVPLPNNARQVTGKAAGTFASRAPMQLVLTIPGLGQQTISISVSGRFGGTLISSGPLEVSFIGSWSATAGDQNYGGDLLITVPIDDLPNLKTIPFSVVGNLLVNPGIGGAPNMTIPLNVTGSFPFVLQ